MEKKEEKKEKESAALGSGMRKAGSAGDDAPRAGNSPFFGTGMCKAGFTGEVAPHDVPVPVGMCKAGFAGEEAHDALSVPVASATGMCRPGFSAMEWILTEVSRLRSGRLSGKKKLPNNFVAQTSECSQ